MRRTIMSVNIVQDQQQRKVAGGVSHMPLSERYDKECGDVSQSNLETRILRWIEVSLCG